MSVAPIERFHKMRDQILQSEKQLVPLNAWFNSSPFLARTINIIQVAKHVIGLQSTTGGLSMFVSKMMNSKRLNVQEYVNQCFRNVADQLILSRVK